jgi:hypothetical protein
LILTTILTTIINTKYVYKNFHDVVGTEVDLWDILNWLQAGPGTQLALGTDPSTFASSIRRIDSEEK